jgi:hypothetical protein
MAKQEIVLHVGLHKTGTSSIQDALAGYDDKTTAYADLGDPNHSVFLQTVFDSSIYDEYWVRLGLSNIEFNKLGVGYLQRLKAQLTNERSRTVFSGENISRFNLTTLNDLKCFFQRYTSNLTVVVFVRDPISVTKSFIQEFVKHGDLNWLNQGIVCLNMSGHIKNLVEVFGASNVRILQYEDATDPNNGSNGDLVQYFCGKVGLDKCLVPLKMHSNKSIEFLTIQLLIKFYQSGMVHNQGEVLERVRWKFIECLNGLVIDSIPGATDKYKYHHFVDWSDVYKLNLYVKNPYTIVTSAKPISSSKAGKIFSNDDNFEQASAVIAEYLRSNGMRIANSPNLSNLLMLLFIYILREDALRSA